MLPRWPYYSWANFLPPFTFSLAFLFFLEKNVGCRQKKGAQKTRL